MDYLCAKFDNFSFRRFGFILQTDRQTESQTRMNAILTRLPSASVITVTSQHTNSSRLSTATRLMERYLSML